MSLQSALELLGFRRCYHMLEVAAHPEHTELWHQAATGQSIDWDHLFAGYRAAVDWPTCYFWRELSARYADAKVILTTRDPDRWYDSVANTIYVSMTGGVPNDDPDVLSRRRMARNIILDRTFDGRFDDRAYALQVYRSHIAEVQRVIEPARLLVYEVADGWDPLCRFLDVPLPREAFPRINSTDEFRTRMGLDKN